MGFRFRKRIRIAPGVHLNASLKRGLSASFGRPGATVNVGLDGKQKNTLGAPGTGLTYETESASGPGMVRAAVVVVVALGLLGLFLLR